MSSSVAREVRGPLEWFNEVVPLLNWILEEKRALGSLFGQAAARKISQRSIF